MLPTKSVEFTDEELRHLLMILHLSGFREKREFRKGMRGGRTDEMKIIGRVIKKLRHAKALP